MAHRVRGAENRVGERQPGLQRGLGHQHAGAPSPSGRSMVRDQVVGHHLRRPAARDGRSAGCGPSDTNASMPWVSASRPVAALSHSGIVVSSARVDDGDVGHQRAAQDGDLGVAGGVGDDAELRDVGTGARRRRHHHERRDRHLAPCPRPRSRGCCRRWRPGSPRPWRRRSPIRRRPPPAHRSRARRTSGSRRRSRGPSGWASGSLHTRASTPWAFEVAENLVGPARLDEAGVGDEHRPQCAQAQRRMRGLDHRVDAEDDLRGVELQQPGAAARACRARTRGSAPAPSSIPAEPGVFTFATGLASPTTARGARCLTDARTHRM